LLEALYFLVLARDLSGLTFVLLVSLLELVGN
jgi:hypothetical protein